MNLLPTIVVLLIITSIATGQQAQHFGSCYTDDECPRGAFCALWTGCFMGTCVCSEDPSEAFGCLWKKAGATCLSDASTNECHGPPSVCQESKCSCSVGQSPARHSAFFCDDLQKAGRDCVDNSVLRRGESCSEEGKVFCWTDFREDPHTGECRSGMPGETCSKNDECESNNCTSSLCACPEEMRIYSENIRIYSGNGFNVSSVKKCKPANAPSSSVSAGGACGGYLTCQGATCMECPEGGVYVCVDLSTVGSVTNSARGTFSPTMKLLLFFICCILRSLC